MSNKFNSNALNEYSKSYARRVAADFYHAHPTISGKQILNLTPIQQVNLFVVSSLFDKWKGEVERFRSPYFDFSNPEVEEGLRAFMNVVSQHIAVRREHLEPLLADASRRTLVALFDPRYYYDELLRNQPDFTLTADSLKHITRYTQVNKFVPLALEQKMNGRPFVYVNQALGYLDEILSQRVQELERPEKYVTMFSEKVAIDLASLLRGQSLDGFQSTAAKSFFDLDEEPPKPPLVAQPQRVMHDPTPPPALPVPVPQPVAAANDDQPSGVSFADADPESASSSVTGPNNVPNVTSSESNASPLAVSTSSGSESIMPASDGVATLGDTLQKVNTGGLSRSISLNQKFRFINQLFNGNVDAYNEAIVELDQMTNYGQALDLISYRYANQFMWNMDSDEVSELVEILKRRF